MRGPRFRGLLLRRKTTRSIRVKPYDSKTWNGSYLASAYSDGQGKLTVIFRPLWLDSHDYVGVDRSDASRE